MIEDGMLDSHSSWGGGGITPFKEIGLRVRQFIRPQAVDTASRRGYRPNYDRGGLNVSHKGYGNDSFSELSLATIW